MGWNGLMRLLCPRRAVLAKGCAVELIELSLARENPLDTDPGFKVSTCTGLKAKYPKIGAWGMHLCEETAVPANG